MTTMCVRPHRIIAGIILISGSLVFGVQEPAHSEQNAPVRVSGSALVIASQLRTAVQLERRALEKLTEPKVFETLDEVRPLMNRAYALIRAARSGMIEARGAQKFVDPLLEYEIDRTTKAWDLARGPVDWTYNAMPRDQYLAAATRDLNAVIALLEEVLEVMP